MKKAQESYVMVLLISVIFALGMAFILMGGADLVEDKTRITPAYRLTDGLRSARSLPSKKICVKDIIFSKSDYMNLKNIRKEAVVQTLAFENTCNFLIIEEDELTVDIGGPTDLEIICYYSGEYDCVVNCVKEC